jgi:hypothetical protein
MALADWTGRYAQEFSDDWNTQLSAGQELLDGMLVAAARIERAIESARYDQRRREQGRVEFWSSAPPAQSEDNYPHADYGDE